MHTPSFDVKILVEKVRIIRDTWVFTVLEGTRSLRFVYFPGKLNVNHPGHIAC